MKPPLLVRFEGGPVSGQYRIVEPGRRPDVPARFLEFEEEPPVRGVRRGDVVYVIFHRYERGSAIKEVTGKVWFYVYMGAVVGSRDY